MIRPNKNLQYISKYKPSDRGSDSKSKLDWNECNIPFEPEYLEILRNAIANISLTEYPDIQNDSLISKLAAYCQVAPENVQIFNGSDSALHYIFAAYLNHDSKVLIYYPHYNQIETYIRLYTEHVAFSHIDDVFDGHGYNFDEIAGHTLVYINTPNNPTGYSVDNATIESLLKKYPDTLFLLDEAYYEFCGESAAHLVRIYDNIIISRTFSKAFSLASIRLGYICCAPSLLNEINKIRNPKEVNAFAQVLGETALDNFAYVRKRIELVNTNLAIFKQGLDKLGIEYVDSKANFILIRINEVANLIAKLKAESILVRDRSMFQGLENCVRISVGEEWEMNKILDIIRQHISQ